MFMISVIAIIPILVTITKCQNSVECDRILPFYYNSSTRWALQMLDATAKIPSGLLNGNVQGLGSFDQCVTINEKQDTTSISGKYCLGTVTSGSSFVRLGVCIPSVCSVSQVEIDIDTSILQAVTNSTNVAKIFTEDQCQTRDSIHPPLTTGAIVGIVILSLYISCILLATCIERYNSYKQKKVPKFCSVLSLVTSVKKLVANNTTQNHIPFLEGLRIISMLLVIFFHSFQIAMGGPIENLYDMYRWLDRWHSQLLLGSTVSVDTFFVITGFLTTYSHLCKTEKRYEFNILQFYLNKFLRITPSFAAAVLIVATLFTYLGTGPFWLFANDVQAPCKSYWWSSLLYIQNYYNVNDMCITPSWYLDAYMQLTLVSPLILIPLTKYTKYTLIFLGVLFLYSLAFPFFVTWYYELPALLTNSYGNLQLYFEKYYYVTHARISPWVIGLVLGYIVYQIKIKRWELKFHRVITIILWCICFSTLFVCLIAGFDNLKKENYDYWGNALHNALVRPCWSIAISWIILACFSGNGGVVKEILGIPLFGTLGKLVFAVYIVHKPIIYMLTYSKRTPLYFNFANFLTEGGANTVYAFSVAGPWAVLFEFPFAELQPKILNKNRGKNQSN